MAKKENPLRALRQSEEAMLRHCRALFKGQITNLERRSDDGFSKGTAKLRRIKGHSEFEFVDAEHIFVEIQNENLMVRTEQRALATVPDLIVLFDDEFRAVSTEELRFGLRATVVVFPAHPLLKSKEALAVVGPRAFGYDVDYVPIDELEL